MCVPRFGTVAAMYSREVDITPFIASDVTRGGISDPTTMLAHSAVEVCLVVIPQSGWGRSILRKACWADGCGIQAEEAVPVRCTDFEGGFGDHED